MFLKNRATLDTKFMLLGGAMITLGILWMNGGSMIGVVGGIVVIILGALLFPGFEAFELDAGSGILKKQVLWGPLKLTLKKMDIRNADKVSMALFSQNQRMNVGSQSSNVSTRSYDVSIVCGDAQYIVYESTEIKKALAKAEEIAEYLEVPFQNKYQEMVDALQSRRDR